MKVFKAIFYLITLLTCCFVIGDYSYSNNGYDGAIAFGLFLGILYWIYKLLKTLMDIMTDIDYGSDYDYKKNNYKKPDKDYYNRYQPNPDHRWSCNRSSSYVYDSVENEKKKAEEIGKKIQIRKDIQIVEIVKKEK